jgi:hypothetical protein
MAGVGGVGALLYWALGAANNQSRAQALRERRRRLLEGLSGPDGSF